MLLLDFWAVVSTDAFARIVALSLGVSLSATALATLLGTPLGQLWRSRTRLVTAILAGFGRTISEVGAILIVAGNIAEYTRTMTTAIVLETSKGNLSLALGLGLVLIEISVAVGATIFALGNKDERWW